MTRRGIFAALLGLPALLMAKVRDKTTRVTTWTGDPFDIDMNDPYWNYAARRPVDADCMTEVYNRYGHRVGYMVSGSHEIATGRMYGQLIAVASSELLEKTQAKWKIQEKLHPGSSEAERLEYVAALERTQGADRSVWFTVAKEVA
jgi:hypothetical protein